MGGTAIELYTGFLGVLFVLPRPAALTKRPLLQVLTSKFFWIFQSTISVEHFYFGRHIESDSNISHIILYLDKIIDNKS